MAEHRKGYEVDPKTGLTDPEKRAGLTRQQAEAQAGDGKPLSSPKPGLSKGRHRDLAIAAAAVGGGFLLLIVLAIALGGGGDESSKGKRSETHAAAPPPARPPGDTANLWIDADGGSCSRSTDPTAYSDPGACSSFAAAYSAAQGGDVVRIKSATYDGPQSTGGSKTPSIRFVGEDGAVVRTTHADNSLHGLDLLGHVSVENVDVGGDAPSIFIGGNNSTWRDSRMLAASIDPAKMRGNLPGAPEPILIYSDSAPVTNAKLSNIVVEPQRATNGYHLESVRIDQNVNGVLLDRVTFLPGSDDNTATVFITTPSLSTFNPTNVTIQNSVFFANRGSYAIQGGNRNLTCTNWAFLYNTFAQERDVECGGSASSIKWVGNLGPKSSNGIACTPGTTWRKNIWQWDGDPRVCSGEAANETWLNGPRYSISAAGLDSNYRPNVGSAVIDKGETSCLPEDRDGNPRPVGAACDVGAFERQG